MQGTEDPRVLAVKERIARMSGKAAVASPASAVSSTGSTETTSPAASPAVQAAATTAPLPSTALLGLVKVDGLWSVIVVDAELVQADGEISFRGPLTVRRITEGDIRASAQLEFKIQAGREIFRGEVVQ